MLLLHHLHRRNLDCRELNSNTDIDICLTHSSLMFLPYRTSQLIYCNNQLTNVNMMGTLKHF